MQAPDGGEAVVFHQLHHCIAHGAGGGGGAKGTGVHVPARPSGDLTDLGRAQFAVAQAVKLALGREGDVVHVHVQAHADCIGGDQIIDLAGLIQSHLGVAGAGAERPHDHRRAAALTAHQLGQGIDVGGRKRHDGAAPGQAGEFLFAAI